MITMRVPFDIGHTGRVALAQGEYEVAAQYLKTLLLTRIGERIMRPSYGSQVRDNVFEHLDEVTLQSIEGDIRDAVRTWEPGVIIHQVLLDVDGETLQIDIQFTVSSTLGEAPSTMRVSIDVGGSVEEF